MYDKEQKEKIKKVSEIIKKYNNLDYEVTALHNKSNQKILYEYDETDKKFFKIRGSIK